MNFAYFKQKRPVFMNFAYFKKKRPVFMNFAYFKHKSSENLFSIYIYQFLRPQNSLLFVLFICYFQWMTALIVYVSLCRSNGAHVAWC